MLRFSRMQYSQLFKSKAVSDKGILYETMPKIYFNEIRPVPSFYSKKTIFLTTPASFFLSNVGIALLDVSNALNYSPRYIRSVRKRPYRNHVISVRPHVLLYYKSPIQRFKPADVAHVIRKSCTICHVWQNNEWVKVPLDDSKESMKIWSTVLPTSITALSGEMI
eukprot:PhF_6_TR34040/c0_g1_i1/m.49790